MKKYLAVAVILLFISVSVIPSTGREFYDDTTPPVTTHALDPPEPEGDNGWYISNVTVTLNATDDISGVKEIRYNVNGVPGNILGSYGTFNITDDGDDILIEYYAIDNAENIEDINSFTIDMDQTIPEIEWVRLDGNIKKYRLYSLTFICNATDETSGMDRVEMYINGGLHEVNNTPDGDIYDFVLMWSSIFWHYITFEFVHYDKAGNNVSDEINTYGPPSPDLSIIGIINNPVILDDEVSFYAIMTLSTDGIFMFKRLTFRGGWYGGFIGKHFILADFYEF